MAGAGYKLYSTGDVLTASDVNTYIQQQTVMVFADASARTTALTGVVAEGMLTYLKDTDVVQYYSGSGWVTVNTDQTPLTTKGDLFTYSTADARLPVGNDGETLLADSSATTGLRWQSAYNGNGVINGALDFWQRGTSFTTNGYAADRWYFFPAGVAGRTCTRQSSNLTGFNYCARVARDSGNSGTTNIGFLQSFATEEALRFAGQTATVSFYARAGANYSPTSSLLTPYIISGTGTDQNRAGANYTGESIVSSSTVTLTTSWQRFTKTVTFASTVTEFAIYFEASPTGTAGAADYFEVTGVQIELGSVATTFKRSMNTLAGELAACQRYYYEMAFSGAAPYASGVANLTTSAVVLTGLPVVMRTSPTAVYTGTFRIEGGTSKTGIASTDLSLNQVQNQQILTAVTSTGLTIGDGFVLLANGTSAIKLSAEL
jgi:hypothetical protein